MEIIAVVIFVLIPIAVGVAMTRLAFRRMTPLAFRCGRCGVEFRQPPHHSFPTACPQCGAHDWNA